MRIHFRIKTDVNIATLLIANKSDFRCYFFFFSSFDAKYGLIVECLQQNINVNDLKYHIMSCARIVYVANRFCGAHQISPKQTIEKLMQRLLFTQNHSVTTRLALRFSVWKRISYVKLRLHKLEQTIRKFVKM